MIIIENKYKVELKEIYIEIQGKKSERENRAKEILEEKRNFCHKSSDGVLNGVKCFELFFFFFTLKCLVITDGS